MEDKDIIKDLLRKFHRHGIWGKHHWREENIVKGFPSHVRNRVMNVAEDLRRKGLLIKRPSSHGYQWYANIEKIKEIEEIIKDP